MRRRTCYTCDSRASSRKGQSADRLSRKRIYTVFQTSVFQIHGSARKGEKKEKGKEIGEENARKTREREKRGLFQTSNFGVRRLRLYRTDKNSLSYGNYVKIDHGNGIVTLLAHMKYNSVVVKVGDKVKRGDKIGIMGNTGYSKGTHLHYEVMINKEKVEPFKYTYATNEHIVGSGTKSKYNILYLREDIKEMEEVKDNKSDNTPSDDVKEDNVIFEYVVPKDGIYKIRLNQNEKLVIKD